MITFIEWLKLREQEEVTAKDVGKELQAAADVGEGQPKGPAVEVGKKAKNITDDPRATPGAIAAATKSLAILQDQPTKPPGTPNAPAMKKRMKKAKKK